MKITIWSLTVDKKAHHGSMGELMVRGRVGSYDVSDDLYLVFNESVDLNVESIAATLGKHDLVICHRGKMGKRTKVRTRKQFLSYLRRLYEAQQHIKG